jgi:hypothetical protein
LTGGHKAAQDPVHLEVVGVSGANQYKVRPWELVSTCWLPMVLAVRVVPLELGAGADEAGLLAPAAGVLPEVVELLPELAHADRASARTASPAAPHIFLIRIFSPAQCK